jgi:hypothetical protein
LRPRHFISLPLRYQIHGRRRDMGLDPLDAISLGKARELAAS